VIEYYVAVFSLILLVENARRAHTVAYKIPVDHELAFDKVQVGVEDANVGLVVTIRCG
jgi:hypothetical protein